MQSVSVFKYFAIIATLISITLVSSQNANAQDQERLVYVVKTGDTLFSISKDLGVSITEIQNWNQLSSNSLSVGQELIYFKGERERVVSDLEEDLGLDAGESLLDVKPTPSNTFYTVKSGDSLYKIARDFGMTITQLKELNGLKSDVLSIGQRLLVKAPSSIVPNVNEFTDQSSAQGMFVLYTIEAGELLSDLLIKFQMKESEFIELNPEIDIRRLTRGQKITVLLPPTKEFENPYLAKSNLEDLGLVSVIVYENAEKGKTTTNGELYNPDELSAAHSNIALGSLIYIENPENGRGTYVRVNDRTTGESLKLSQKAFELLAFNPNGQKSVSIYVEN